jgi:hypothetical protein
MMQNSTETDKTKGEITGKNFQLADSQSRNSGTLSLLTVMVSLKGMVSVKDSLRAKYCAASLIALRLTMNCLLTLKKSSDEIFSISSIVFLMV